MCESARIWRGFTSDCDYCDCLHFHSRSELTVGHCRHSKSLWRSPCSPQAATVFCCWTHFDMSYRTILPVITPSSSIFLICCQLCLQAERIQAVVTGTSSWSSCLCRVFPTVVSTRDSAASSSDCHKATQMEWRLAQTPEFATELKALIRIIYVSEMTTHGTVNDEAATGAENRQQIQ